MRSLGAGDFCYLHAGTYAGAVYDPHGYGKYAFSFDGSQNGSTSAPIYVGGYPGERPVIGTQSVGCVRWYGGSYFILDNLTFDASVVGSGTGADNIVYLSGNNNALINCFIGNCPYTVYGMIGLQGNGNRAWGCEVTGDRSGDKLNHAFYMQGCTGADVGWCWIHDNNCDVGPMFKNEQGGYETFVVHDCILDARNSQMDLYDAEGGGSTWWCNNLIYPSVTSNRGSSFYYSGASVEAYNNTFVGGNSSGGNPIFTSGSTVYNNIFDGCPAPAFGGGTHSYNHFYNTTVFSETGGSSGNPMLDSNYRLGTVNSPVYRSGTGSNFSTYDLDGIPRNNPPCKGCYEYNPDWNGGGGGGGGLPPNPTYYTISGHIADNHGANAPGITVYVAGDDTANTVTNAQGNYSIANVPQYSNVTVIPNAANWTFSPSTITISNIQADAANENFVGTNNTTIFYVISGSVTYNGAAVPNVSMNLTLNGADAGNIVSFDGQYSFSNIPGGSTVTVRPSLGYWTFTPAYQTFSNVQASHTAVNFTGIPASLTATISGFVLDNSSRSIDSSLISMSGSFNQTQSPGGGGAFSFTGVPIGSQITLTPSAPFYTFSPVSVSTASLQSNWSVGTLFGTAATAVSTGTPVISYSDLLSGPDTGGVNNEGAFITIYGKNFGASRGASTITLGGGEVAQYWSWNDSKITFQPGINVQDGNIVVHVSGQDASNGVPFDIRPGNIFFVNVSAAVDGDGSYASPWIDLRTFYVNAQPGDICYIRAGTYSGKYMDNSGAAVSNFLPTAGGVAGTLANPITYAAFPGETVRITAAAPLANNIDFETVTHNGFQFVNLTFSSAGMSIYMSGDGLSLIGCTITALDRSAQGATIHLQSITNSRFIGNTLAGCPITTMTRGYDMRLIGVNSSTISYNTSLASNVNALGPLLYITGLCQNINIFCNNFNGGGSINTRALIEACDSGSTMNIYNNIFQNVATDYTDYGVFNFWGGGANFYFNTVYNVHGINSTGAAIFRIGGASVETINIENNILFSDASTPVFYFSDANGAITSDYNDYWNCVGLPADVHSIVQAPHFVNNGSDFHLLADSPVIGKGTTLALVPRDRDWVLRPASPAIGAYEYLAPYTPPSPPTPPSGGMRIFSTFLE
jgi:hypothetical protein